MLGRGLMIFVVALAACWPAWSIPDLDGTEGRRVQIALEMLRSGDWMVPTLGGEPTWAKPPLHYWLLCVCIEAFGDATWVVRLPSVLGAWATAWLAGELLRPRASANTSAPKPKPQKLTNDQLATEPPRKVQSTLVQSPLPRKIIGMTRCSGKLSTMP